MKKMLFMSLFALTVCVSSLAAQTPPQAVLTAFRQKFTDLKKVHWGLEKNGEWEAEFDGADGKEISANFSAAGKWLETETEIAFSELPAPVQTALQGKKVKETARIQRADGSVIYEAEVKRKDLLFDASGNMLQ